MFDIFDKTAKAVVNFTTDSIDGLLGGEGPKREDVIQMLSAGMTVAAIASALDVGEEIIQQIVSEENDD